MLFRSALSNQRYRDAVESFKGLVQTQYAELGSVKNSRNNTWACGSNAKPVAGNEYRGQSNCVIVGRYMTIDQRDVSIYTVLARKGAGATTGTDVTSLKNNYTYNVADDIEKRSLEWGTSIAWPVDGAPTRTIGILFMRSPETGRVYTFSGDDIPSSPEAINSATFTSMMNEAVAIPGQSQRTICIKSGGGIFGGDRAVYITSRAAGASAVEVRSNDLPGVGVKC